MSSNRRPEMDEYTPIKLPNTMIKQIDLWIQDHPEYDFKTRPQLLKYLIRRFIEEQKNQDR